MTPRSICHITGVVDVALMMVVVVMVMMIMIMVYRK
jgi:hypothetical protein